MKILLISANTTTTPYPVYPLGLDYVAAALEPEHQVRILDMNLQTDGNEPDGAIAAFGPDLIGLGLRNVDNTDVNDPVGFMAAYRRLMDRIRGRSAAPVVLGGSGFTLFPQEILGLLQADYGIVGEGERLGLLVAALEAGRDPAGLPGVVTPGDSQPRAAAPQPPPWNQPVQRGFGSGRLHAAFYLQNGGMLNLQTKRGCPFRCVYCTYPAIEGRSLRLVDPDEVAREALELERAGARYLFITDSAFNAHTEHSLAVARAFRRAGLTIPWGAFFAPAALPQDYFQVMRDCGLAHVEFGTESLSDPVLSAYRKPFDRRQVQSAHAAALAAGLHVAHYFLFGGPGETPQTLAETLDGIERLDSAAFFLFCGMRIYPNTGLHRIALQQGVIDCGRDLVEPVFYHSPAMGGDSIPERVAQRAAGRQNWLVGSVGEETAKKLLRLYGWGYTGPLWELLIP